MSILVIRLVAFFVILASTSMTSASDVYVDFRATQSGQWSAYFFAIPSPSANSQVLITPSTSGGQFRMWTPDAGQDLPQLVVIANDGVVVDVQITRPLNGLRTGDSGLPGPNSPLLATGRNWGGMISRGNQVSLQASIIGSVVGGIGRTDSTGPSYTQATSPSGAVRCYRLDIGQDLDGGSTVLELSPAIGSTIGSISARTLTQSTTLRIRNGMLSQLQLSGDLLGIVNGTGSGSDVFQGSLDTVSVTGKIGSSPTNRTAITTWGGIGSIFASNFYADVNTGQLGPTTAAQGAIGQVSISGTPGDFVGSFNGTSFNDGSISIAGTLFGQIQFHNAAGTGAIAAQRQIAIGRDLASTGRILLDAGGLGGQIVVGNLSGVWASGAEVRVGSTTFSAPYYINTSAPLGGGAAGLAPFHMHESDCIPPHNILNASSSPHTLIEPDWTSAGAVPVKIRHYGPIALRTGTWQSTVRIDCKPLGLPGCTWFDMTSHFGVRAPSGNGVAARTLGISPVAGEIPKAGIYRVTLLRAGNPPQAKVGSAGVAGTPPVVWPNDPCDADSSDGIDQAFYFRIGPDCDGNLIDDTLPGGLPNSALCPHNDCRVNFNGDDTISVQDIFDFLNAWFDSCLGLPSQQASPCFGRNADFNTSGQLEVQDVFDYLNAWFAFDLATPCH